MNTAPTNQPRHHASVLVITLTVVVIAGILLSSYLIMVQTQAASVARSQAWNSIIPVSEAGVEEAMALINKNTPIITSSNIDTANAWTWTNTVTADGWSAFTNGITTVTRTVSGSSSYTVSINIANGVTPIIDSIGTVPYTSVPWVFSLNHLLSSPPSAPAGCFLAAATAGGSFAAPTSSTVGRHVNVQAALTSLFADGLVARSNINMNGNNVRSDSFVSTDTNHSVAALIPGFTNQIWIYTNTAGIWKAGGDVATDDGLINGLNLGNANIYGHISTGPGSLQNYVQIGNNGSVGGVSTSVNGQIQPGFWAGDFNISFPDVPAPTYGGFGLPAAGGVTQTNFVGYIPFNGNYTVGSLTTGNLLVTGPTQLWVQGSFNPNTVVIAPTNNATLVVYVGTANAAGNDSLDLAGNNNLNFPGYARNFQLYGLPSLKSVTFHGNAGFTGTIYAPDAAMTGGGGGNNTEDTSGAMIVKSVTLNGHWNFHYDESLKVFGPSRGWVASSWQEVKYP